MIYLRPVYAPEILSDAKQCANVMHPCYIWPGLCKRLKRNPTQNEWFEIIKDSPFLKEKTNDQ